MKSIVAKNTVQFLQEFCSDVKNGWALQPSRYAVTVMHNFVEATLVKAPQEEYDLIPFSEKHLNIEALSFSELCYNIQKYVSKDWEVDYNTLQDSMIFKNSVSLVREIPAYTKEELDAMEWSEVSVVGKAWGVFNRGRNVMTAAILKAQEEAC